MVTRAWDLLRALKQLSGGSGPLSRWAQGVGRSPGEGAGDVPAGLLCVFRVFGLFFLFWGFAFCGIAESSQSGTAERSAKRRSGCGPRVTSVPAMPECRESCGGGVVAWGAPPPLVPAAAATPNSAPERKIKHDCFLFIYCFYSIKIFLVAPHKAAAALIITCHIC